MLRLRGLNDTVFLCAFAVAATLVWTNTAAAERRVLVMPVETVGRLRDAAKWRGEFELSLIEKLKESRFQVVNDSAKLTLKEQVCHESHCLPNIAQAHRADLIVGGKVINDGQVPPTMHVHVWVFDPAKPLAFTNEVERQYRNASESDVAEALAKQLGEALAGPAPPRPAASDLPAEKPTVAAGAASAGAPSSALPSDTPPPQSRSGQRILWLTLGAVGVAGTVAGAIAFGIEAHRDGQPSCSEAVPPKRKCPYEVDTHPGIIASGVVGIASIGLATMSFILASRVKNEHRAWVAPVIGIQSAGVAIGGTF